MNRFISSPQKQRLDEISSGYGCFVTHHSITWLKTQGHDAVHLREEGLQRLPDEQILVKARAESRILLTMDLDFGYLMAISGQQMPSVILFRLSDERAATVNERLTEVFAQCQSELELGVIASVNDETIRIRKLPI